MADQTIIRGIAVGGVQHRTGQTSGRNYWIITDDQGQEWRCFDGQTAMGANQLQGQLAVMTVSITPATDPSWGMNYRLKKIAPAPAGAQPTGPLPLMQPEQQQFQQFGQPQQFQQPAPANVFPQPVQQPAVQQPAPQIPAVSKTLGQGGHYSDADVTRMARSTAIEAVIGVAFTSDDFRHESGDVNWEAVYAVAEAAHKFIVDRRHEGWVPGQEISPSSNDSHSNEQAVLAQVQAEFPGTVVQGMPEPTSQGSASNVEDEGDDIPWGE